MTTPNTQYARCGSCSSSKVYYVLVYSLQVSYKIFEFFIMVRNVDKCLYELVLRSNAGGCLQPLLHNSSEVFKGVHIWAVSVKNVDHAWIESLFGNLLVAALFLLTSRISFLSVRWLNLLFLPHLPIREGAYSFSQSESKIFFIPLQMFEKSSIHLLFLFAYK